MDVVGVRDRLHAVGLNLNQVSKASGPPPYFVPHCFYRDLRRGETPHVCQVLTLSEITGQDFEGWLLVFGYDLRVVPQLQACLQRDVGSIGSTGSLPRLLRMA